MFTSNIFLVQEVPNYTRLRLLLHAYLWKIKKSWSSHSYWNISGIHIGSWHIGIKRETKLITNISASLGSWTTHWMLKEYKMLVWSFSKMLGYEKTCSWSTMNLFYRDEIIFWVIKEYLLTNLVTLFKIFHVKAIKHKLVFSKIKLLYFSKMTIAFYLDPVTDLLLHIVPGQ